MTLSGRSSVFSWVCYGWFLNWIGFDKMKKPNEMRWIVHPHSYKKTNTEISVIHESEFHGLQSYGWFSARKIFIYTDSMYGVAPPEVKTLLVQYAEQLRDKMNAEHPVPVEECERLVKSEIDKKAKEAEFFGNLEGAFKEAFSKELENK
jgi:hypothetical protein